MDQLFYNKHQAAEKTGVSVRTIERAIERGELKASYPTARPLIAHDDLMAWGMSDRRAS